MRTIKWFMRCVWFAVKSTVLHWLDRIFGYRLISDKAAIKLMAEAVKLFEDGGIHNESYYRAKIMLREMEEDILAEES